MPETMPKDTDLTEPRAGLERPRFFNRELSDLDFVKRVLESAEDAGVPVLERLNFLIITEGLLDEFYRIRITALRTHIRNGDKRRTIDGLTPRENLAAIDDATNDMLLRQGRCWQDISKSLGQVGVEILVSKDLDQEDHDWISKNFDTEIGRVLKPIIIGAEEPLPELGDGQTYVVARLHAGDGEKVTGLLPLPKKLPRFYDLCDDKRRFVTLETILKQTIEKIFDKYTVGAFGLARVLREGNLHRASDSDDLPRLVASALEQRTHADVIRLNVNNDMSPELRQYLHDALRITETREGLGLEVGRVNDVTTSEYVAVDGLIGLAGAGEIAAKLQEKETTGMVFPAMAPLSAGEHLGRAADIFAVIREKDQLLHYPYHDFGVVLDFLQQASDDPDVEDIKVTLYRVGTGSPLVKILESAAQNGKNVTAIVELEARDDEEANLDLAKTLKAAGASVHYGFLDKKVHAKAMLVTRREGDERRCYVNFSTGNYHAGNARMYTDLSLFTADPVIGRDVVQLFDYLVSETIPDFQEICIAPHSLRKVLLELIECETVHAREGKPATIWLKLNKLTDQGLIEALYDAAEDGVDISIVVRGICCLNPEFPNGRGRINVKSIIGRFLEHSRIYCFGNGAKMSPESASVFLSSADWMPHKIDGRVELMAPVKALHLKDYILGRIMQTNLSDKRNSWKLAGDGKWTRCSREGVDIYESLKESGG